MKTDVLRKKYLEFFKKKGHVVFSSDSLVPDDVTVLFTPAGMNQFKPYFLGQKQDVKRAASCQKCLRTGDLEEVGQTLFHHTFFEMLGNFSFGDYFKKGAITLAWEFLLKELNLKEGDLWVSVYKDDDEAYDIWRKDIGVPAKKIVKLDEKENFWPAAAPTLGPNGPCGPCSEIFFDKGERAGCGKATCSPACDCSRFVEVWNLVFTQFNRIGKNTLEPLPQKNIDTGMGLERMASVLQGKNSNFEIDILAPAVSEVTKLLKVKDKDSNSGLINAIVDHARAATFAIADGVYPSNEERGYVVRKIIRRALWRAQLLGLKKPFLSRLSVLFAELMQGAYPEVARKMDVINTVLRAEEEKFLSTLKEGRQQFLTVAKKLKQAQDSTVSAQDLFRLYDTYGFPLELSRELAGQHDLAIDQEGFDSLLKEQQARSRQQSMFSEEVFLKDSKVIRAIKEKVSNFMGYERNQLDSQIVLIYQGDKALSQITPGQTGWLVLDQTPFYAESGGQLSDKGTIKTNNDAEFQVEKVIKLDEAVIHQGQMKKGIIKKGQKVQAAVDETRRKALRRAHSATHILQAALRQVLGDHVAQQGSLVDEDRLRFDFAHFEAVGPGQLKEVGRLANEHILAGLAVKKKDLTLAEAKKQGALAFFKDKYQDQVRMVSVGEFSKELCGGLHVDRTPQIGVLAIVSESSIASGVRRIEAVVGCKAQRYLAGLAESARAGAAMLNCPAGELPEFIAKLQKELKAARRQGGRASTKDLRLAASKVAEQAEDVDGVKVMVAKVEQASRDDLLGISDILRQQTKEPAFILLDSEEAAGKEYFACTTNSAAAVKFGLSCKKFIADCGQDLGLKGGGRDNLVQGVVTKKQDDFLAKAKKCLANFIGKKP